MICSFCTKSPCDQEQMSQRINEKPISSAPNVMLQNLGSRACLQT